METATENHGRKFCGRPLLAQELANKRAEIWPVLKAKAPQAADFIKAFHKAFQASTTYIYLNGEDHET